jgi:deoxyribonuclease V
VQPYQPTPSPERRWGNIGGEVVNIFYNRYNRGVKAKRLHDWRLGVSEAQDIQRRLAVQVSRKSELAEPRLIAGVDMSVERPKGTATAAVVVLTYPELDLVEMRTVRQGLDFTYIPGLLSFRESPVILAACEQLTTVPDLLMVDGQGLAHPRRFGIACHLGLLLDIPAIGCAKSLLCGRHEPPGGEPGNYAKIIDRGEIIGAVLRTKPGTSPVYVSIGHRVDLETATGWVLRCCRGYRLPEPLRLAHLAAGGNLTQTRSGAASEAGHQKRLFD